MSDRINTSELTDDERVALDRAVNASSGTGPHDFTLDSHKRLVEAIEAEHPELGQIGTVFAVWFARGFIAAADERDALRARVAELEYERAVVREAARAVCEVTERGKSAKAPRGEERA